MRRMQEEARGMTDVPELEFVNPSETVKTYRAVLWAAGGQGKSVAAASAPAPILVLSADRPSAYMFARKHHGHTPDSLREVRYKDAGTLDAVYRYVRAHPEIRTLVVDPAGHIVDHLADTAPLRADGDVDYQAVNKKFLGFVKSLRAFDVNVVLVAHEKLNDGKKGDGKLYPALGGPSLINKLIAEMDIVAHIERHVTTGEGQEEVVRWIGQLQPRGNLVCKEGLGVLGDRRIADLSRWFDLASSELTPDESDLPWGTPGDPENRDPDDVREEAQTEMVT